MLVLVAAVLYGLNQLGLLDQGTPELQVTRITGQDPIAAAATAAREAYGGGAETVILVGAESLADGVVATGLAGALEAPILLNDHDRLNPRIRELIRELDATSAVLVGGTQAMRGLVERTLREDLELDTLRIAGASRFDTADLAARRMTDEAPPGELDGLTTALIVPAEDVESGLAPGGIAAGRRNALPVLYSQDGALPEPTTSALRALGIEQVVAIGGAEGFAGRVIDVTDAVDTANTISLLRGFSPARVVVVPDGDHARALIAAPVAGLESGVVLPFSVAEPWLQAACGTVTELIVIAEEAVISEVDVTQMTRAATECA